MTSQSPDKRRSGAHLAAPLRANVEVPPGRRGVGRGLLVLTCRLGPYAAVAFSVALVCLLAGQPAIAVCCAGFALFVVSVIVHEFGHLVGYRLAHGNAAPAVLVIDGLAVRLRRLRGTPGRDTATVVAGPLAPLVLTPLLVPLLEVAPMVVLGWTAIASGHAVMLAVPVGDGAALRELRAARRIASH